jgi:uncharacterized protein (DUF1330 family)
MPALVIAQIKPRDATKLPVYAAAAAPTIAAFGGEVVYRGTFQAALLGDAEPHGLGVLRFPDVNAAKAWFASSAYQAIAPLRDDAGDMTFVLFKVVA